MKHTFTPAEIADLNLEFRQSFANLKSVEAEFDSVKASYKAKTTEAESRMETLNATLQAGFEIRDQNCVIVMDFKQGKKRFYLESEVGDERWLKENPDPLKWPEEWAAITEAITDADRQQELLEAEARFEAREEISLFEPAGDDAGVLAVGRLNGKWYGALRVKIGTRAIKERLDSEQPYFKKRPDLVKRACKRFGEWLDDNLGHEEAKGFKNSVALVVAAHAEREE
ncbi:MAG: hypothetical protein KGL39_15775 [Patescibacteria group bacterium]|nr:hypothetical protein [Patescibacteria group bacterium]